MSDLELARARAKAKAKAMRLREEQPKKNFAPTLEEMEAAKAAVEPTTGEALAGGWVEGIPFLKDASAALDGISESMASDNASFEDAYSRYEEKMKGLNKDLSMAQEQSPWTFAAGEIGGTAATIAAGSAALKAAGAGATLTSTGLGAVSAVGTGAAQGLSRSRDRGVEDVVIGATIGAAGEVGGHYLAKGFKKGGQYLMDKADDIYTGATKKILGLDTAKSARLLSKQLKIHNQKESEFISGVLTNRMKDSDELVIDLAKDMPERTLDKISIYKDQVGKELADMYKMVDDKYKVEVDLPQLKQSLIDDVVEPFMKSDDPDYQEIGTELTKYIERLGTRVKSAKKEVTPEGVKLIEDMVTEDKWNLQRMHRLQKDIRKRIESLFERKNIAIGETKEHHRKVAASLGKHMDEILDEVSTPDDQIFSQVKQARKDFSNNSLVYDALEDNIYRSKDDPLAIMKEAISFKSLLVSGIASKAMGPAGMVVGPVFARVMNNPKTPIYLADGLEAIGKTVSAYPGGKIASRLYTASLLSNDKFEETLYSIVAENNLSASPLPRDTQQMRDQVQDIRHFLKGFDKKLLKQFDTVIESENEDAIGAFMDGLSKAPNAGKFFQSGIGFNGKVYTDDDKMALERQLRMTDMPAAQRMEMMENLRSNGVIPDFNKIVVPQPIKHQPRTKKLKDY